MEREAFKPVVIRPGRPVGQPCLEANDLTEQWGVQSVRVSRYLWSGVSLSLIKEPRMEPRPIELSLLKKLVIAQAQHASQEQVPTIAASVSHNSGGFFNI